MGDGDDAGQLKKTPFYDFHVEAEAKMVPFAGYLMPVQYSGMIVEHLAVRNNVGLFDISHMGEFDVSGPKALEFLQKMTTNDVSELEAGDIQYSCMCYDDGGIVDDLLVYRLDDRYMLVVNAANIAKDFEWLEKHLTAGVDLKNRSDDYGLLALQGPNAQKVMQEISDFDFDALEYYRWAMVPIAGHKLLLSRTGYTGEDGFEIYIPAGAAKPTWEAIVESGRKHDLMLVGLGARDSLRLEMKMALYGNDIDKTTTPIEAGLSWIVKPDKGDFVGRDVIVRQKEEKPERRLVCLEMEGRAFPRTGYEILSEGKAVGAVTSGTFSPSLQKPIALGYVPRRLSKIGQELEVRIRNNSFPARVVKPPFYKGGSHR